MLVTRGWCVVVLFDVIGTSVSAFNLKTVAYSKSNFSICPKLLFDDPFRLHLPMAY